MTIPNPRPFRIFFNHAQKTGGTYCVCVIVNSWKAVQAPEEKGTRKYRARRPEDKASVAAWIDDQYPLRVLVSPHAFHPDVFQKPQPDDLLIASCREPVESFFSAYDYFKHREEPAWHETRSLLFKSQIAAIKEADDFDQYMKLCEGGLFKPYPWGNIIEYGDPRFDYVIRLEHIVEDLTDLCHDLGCEPVFPDTRENPNKSKNMSNRITNRDDYRERVEKLFPCPTT